MKQKENLTNEYYRGIGESNFALAQYAIKLGRYLIRSGHGATIQSVLEEIRRHPNPSYLNELKELEAAEESV